MSDPARILIVDDDPLIVSATQRLLEKAGYEIFTAATGSEALQAAIQYLPDLILLDINMPDMDGFEACRLLKSDPRLIGIFIVIISSTYTDSESQAHGLDLGADGYIARPVSNRELLARVQAMLRIRKAELEIRRLNAELEARVEERTRELRQAQEKLVRQERLAVLGQLAGSVGHELRNPLAVINNAIYYLKLVLPQADPKIQEYLRTIESEVRTADKIINDLLDFARIKAVEREAIPAAELLRRVLERYPAPQNVRLTLDLPPDLPPLWVDPRQIEQVLGNLVLNAYQAMPEGGELTVSSDQLSVFSEQSPNTEHRTPNTEHRSLTTEHWLLITVRDSGVGIPPENMDKLFEPLFTTKPRGIGLGLAVSKRLTEANGGRIQVQSKPGKGTAFTLVLPAAGKEAK